MENTDKKKPSMGKVFGVAFLVVIGIFLVMAMLETVFKDSSSNNNNLNSQDTSLKTTNQKNTPSEINKKSLSPTEEYLNAMIIDYDNVNKLSKAIEVDTNKMIDSELSKEQYCSSLDQAKEIISKSKTSFNNLTLPKDILLLNELEKLRNAIISKINLINSTFKNTDKYCTENSILSLTNARDSLGRINWDYDNRNRPLEADPFSGSATESWDQAVYRISNDIKAKLSSSPKADSAAKNTVYSIGDTIDKGGLKVTLKSVQKDFIHYDYSYLKDDREWTDAEWKEILNYQLKIGTENKESVRQQLIKELNDKYGSRVTINGYFLILLFHMMAVKKQFNTRVNIILDTMNH